MVRLDVRLLSLACCGLEASLGIDQWLARSGSRCNAAGVAEGGSGAVEVLVIAGTITRGGADRVLAGISDLSPNAILVAFGACALSGGPYWDSLAVVWGLSELVAEDPGLASLVERAVAVPGCPPTPAALAEVLDGLTSGAEVQVGVQPPRVAFAPGRE